MHGEIASSSAATEDTDLTGVSQGLERVDLGSVRQDQDTALSFEEKLAALEDIFPIVKAYDIKFTLKKSSNNFNKAVEELLNQAFLESEGTNGEGPLLKKGVEGFSEPTTGRRGRKRKGKKGQLHRRTISMTDVLADKTSNSSSPSSRWDRAKEDLAFISQRTFILSETITATYHKNGGSLPATILAFCASGEPDANPYISEDSVTVLEMHTIDLASEFPSLPHNQAAALVRLSHPSTASAHDLARFLVSSPSSSLVPKIIPQYLPRVPSPPETSSHLASNSSLLLPPATIAALANGRSTSFDQANSAFRKSKSNPHFGGAAAYYSSVGRDASAALRKHEAASADQLVAGQSKSGELDLHGVNVQNAVRIAEHEVNSWWAREAQEWSRRGTAREGALKIVVGKGHHSEGGKGKLGPAVAGMLMKEGWKFSIEQGYINVVGKVRK